MSSRSKTNQIVQSVRDFFHAYGAKYVYATPGTDNHTANFYGDAHVCKLNQGDVVSCIEIAYTNWGLALDEAIEQIFGDLQYERPTA